MSDDRMPGATGRLLVETFEDEGRTRAPDRMLEAVFAETRSRRQARRRPWDGVRLTAVPASTAPVVAAVLVVAGLAVALGPGARPPVPPGPSAPSPAPLPSAALMTCPNGGPMGGDGDTLWVRCPTGLRAIDVAGSPVEGELVEGVGLPASGGAGTWAPAIGGLVEIDPSSGPGRRLEIAGVPLLAVGDSVLWGGTTEGSVVRIDPASGTVTGTIPLGAVPLAIVEAAGSVWVSADDGLVHAFDATTLAPGPTTAVGGQAARLASTEGALYALSQGLEGTVTRIDLAAGTSTAATIATPGDPGSLGELLAADEGVWVTRRNELLRLDPLTLEPGPPLQLPGYPVGIVRDGARAWVVSEHGRLDRVTLP